MATRLELKQNLGEAVEYSPEINSFSTGWNGSSSDTSFAGSEQFGGGYRLRFWNDGSVPAQQILTISPSTSTNFTPGTTYLIRATVDMFRSRFIADPNLPPKTITITLGNVATGANSFALNNVNGQFQQTVVCSDNILYIRSNMIYGGTAYLTDLSITEVLPAGYDELDLYDDVPFPLTFQVDDIANPETRQGAYSKTLVIPGTKRNNKIFNHIFDIESDSVFNPNRKLGVRLTKDTYTQFDGVLKLNKIILNDSKQVDYEVTLFGQVANLFMELGDSMLEDLDFTEYNHVLNRTNQYNSWGSTFAGAQGIVINGVVTDNFTETYRGNVSPNGIGYVYCLMANGKGNYYYNILADKAGANGALAQYRVADIALGFYVYDYLTRIAANAGYTITSDFFESALFKKLVIPPSSKDFLLSTSQVASRLFNVQSRDKSLQLQWGLAIAGLEQVDTIRYNNIISDASTGYYAGGDGVWYVQKGGCYNFTATIGLRWEYSNLLLPSGTWQVGSASGTFPGGAPTALKPVYTNFYLSESFIEVVRIRNGVVTVLGQIDIEIPQDQQALTSSSGNSSTYEFTINSDNIDCLAEDQIYCVLRAKTLVQTDGSPNYNPDHLNEDVEGSLYPASSLFIYPYATGTLINNFPTWYGHTTIFDGVRFTSPDTNAGGIATIVMRSGYTFSNSVVNNGVTEGELLDVNIYTPKNVKQAEFFKWILKMFNCFVLTDPENPTNLLIEPREDFLSTDFISWDEKLDLSKEIIVQPLTELDAKKYIFKYTEDSDLFNTAYTNNTKTVYGTKQIEFDNDWLSGVKDLGIGFSPTPTGLITSGKIALPTIITPENTPTDANIRILFYNGADWHEYNWLHIWQSGSTINYTETETPSLSMFDDLYNPNESLEFGNSDYSFYSYSTRGAIPLTYTNNTLFNKYYSNYTADLTNKNSRLITAYFNLSPIDIYKLDFSKLYFFANHWCRLYSVEDYDPFVNDTTKVTFLKFNEGIAFEPTFIPVDGGDGWYDEPYGGGNA